MRPRFHFTAPRGWINDPHGITYRDGQYHLFYQHVPEGLEWAPNCCWGQDLLHLRRATGDRRRTCAGGDADRRAMDQLAEGLILDGPIIEIATRCGLMAAAITPTADDLAVIANGDLHHLSALTHN
jgi:hypothetical protein